MFVVIVKKKAIRLFFFVFFVFCFYMDVVLGWIFVFFILVLFIGIPTFCICCNGNKEEPLLGSG